MYLLFADVARVQDHQSWIQAPKIMMRSEWGANAAMQPYKVHSISHITVHHAGVATNRSRSTVDKLKGLQAWSQREDKLEGGRTKPAWPDIPYHYYIYWDGTIAECRPWNIVGDTNTEYDPTGHLLICLEGNFEVEQPTGAQIKSLDHMVQFMAFKYKILPSKIESHKDHSKQTTCPGQNLYPELSNLRWRWEWNLKAAAIDTSQWK